jgi:hypothetical protein
MRQCVLWGLTLLVACSPSDDNGLFDPVETGPSEAGADSVQVATSSGTALGTTGGPTSVGGAGPGAEPMNTASDGGNGGGDPAGNGGESTVTVASSGDSEPGGVEDGSGGGGSGGTGVGEGSEGGSSGGGPSSTGTFDGEPPSIVAVSPVDGASGVHADATIVVTFSEPMDDMATEAGYSSDELPVSAVSFQWNEARDEVTIVPEEPLPYTDVATLDAPAQAFTFGFGDPAADLAGNALTPARFAFSTLRRAQFSIGAEEGEQFSGSRRSDDSDGVGNCAPSADVVCAGDSVAESNVQYWGFVTFDLADLPANAEVELAQLFAEIQTLVGNPFSMGVVRVEHVRFSAIDAAAMQVAPLSEVGILAESGEPGELLSIDVTEALAADLGVVELNQYRLRFDEATDGDFNADALVLARDSLLLAVTLLVP